MLFIFAQCLPETYKLLMYTCGLRQFIQPFQRTRDSAPTCLMRKHIIGLEQRKSKHTRSQSERFKTTKDTCVYAQRWDPQSCQQLPTTGSQRKFVMATLVSETNPGLHVYVAIYQVSLSRRTLCHPAANNPCSQVYKRKRFWQFDRQKNHKNTRRSNICDVFEKIKAGCFPWTS